MNTSIWWVAAAIAVVIAGSIYLARASRRKDEERDDTLGVAIHYTAHAKQRMMERGIHASQVESVLANPARRVRDHLENSVRLEGDYDDRILKVWVAEPWPAAEVAVIKSTAWKHVTTLNIPTGQIGRVIGRDGAAIQRLRGETGAQILVNQDGTIRISAGDEATLDSVRQRIVAMTGPRRNRKDQPTIRGEVRI